LLRKSLFTFTHLFYHILLSELVALVRIKLIDIILKIKTYNG